MFNKTTPINELILFLECEAVVTLDFMHQMLLHTAANRIWYHTLRILFLRKNKLLKTKSGNILWTATLLSFIWLEVSLWPLDPQTSLCYVNLQVRVHQTWIWNVAVDKINVTEFAFLLSHHAVGINVIGASPKVAQYTLWKINPRS